MANLVTAEDLLEPGHGCIYLTIGKPTSRRRAAKLQQMKLNEDFIFSYLQRVWGKLAPKEFLYPGSRSVYRRRWDRLLGVLGVPGGLGLLPQPQSAEVAPL